MMKKAQKWMLQNEIWIHKKNQLPTPNSRGEILIFAKPLKKPSFLSRMKLFGWFSLLTSFSDSYHFSRKGWSRGSKRTNKTFSILRLHDIVWCVKYRIYLRTVVGISSWDQIKNLPPAYAVVQCCGLAHVNNYYRGARILSTLAGGKIKQSPWSRLGYLCRRLTTTVRRYNVMRTPYNFARI